MSKEHIGNASQHIDIGGDDSKENTQTPEAIATALRAHGAAPSPWGRGHIQLYMACGLIYLCSTMNGYDGSLMGSINVIPEYQNYYGLGTSGSTSTGLVFSIFQIGQMAGALFTWICDWRGRKITLAVSAFSDFILIHRSSVPAQFLYDN
ncbi:hypothetical protein ACHAP8_007103 [Fusarium lateritium]